MPQPAFSTPCRIVHHLAAIGKANPQAKRAGLRQDNRAQGHNRFPSRLLYLILPGIVTWSPDCLNITWSADASLLFVVYQGNQPGLRLHSDHNVTTRQSGHLDRLYRNSGIR